jgi:hypothetical protein
MKISLLAVVITTVSLYSIFASDMFTCQKCGVTNYGSPLTGSCSRGGFHENIIRSGNERALCILVRSVELQTMVLL